MEKILSLLDGGVWQARTRPFEIIAWPCPLKTAPASEDSSGSTNKRTPDWETQIYPPDLPIFRAHLESFIAHPDSERSFDYRIVVNDGELLWLRQWFIDRHADAESGRPFVTGLVRLVREEKRLQWEVMRTSENERARIGQEIHDDVCQILTGISYLTHVLHQKLLPGQPVEARELEQINLEIQSALDRTRALAHGLLPAKSDFNTLHHALQSLARQVATRFGMQLIVTLPLQLPDFSPESLLHLYRIVQEAASNAFKHGRASRLDVTLETRDNRWVLAMQDNGPGLPQENHRAEGVGLNVMRNRAELLGGWLELCNSPRGGASVEIHLPLRADA